MMEPSKQLLPRQRTDSEFQQERILRTKFRLEESVVQALLNASFGASEAVHR